MMGFKAFHSAKATIDGIETAHMIPKGQLSDENIPAYKEFMALAGLFCPQISAALHFMIICDRTFVVVDLDPDPLDIVGNRSKRCHVLDYRNPTDGIRHIVDRCS